MRFRHARRQGARRPARSYVRRMVLPCSAAIRLALLAAVVPLIPCTAFPQSISGSVVDRTTARPIPGAFVVLRDSTQRRRAGALTDSAGRYALTAPGAGHYEVLAEMIGYAGAAPVALALGAESATRVAFGLSPQAIPLDAIKVTTPPRCKLRSDTSGVVLAIWGEARKALALADWSAQESRLVMVTKRTERVPSRSSRLLGIDTIQGRPPFTTIPPGEIRQGGLIRLEDHGYSYYAPGPDFILSDEFVSTHCFAARVRRDMVGLAFEPIPRVEVKDIRGTLWLDRKSSALRRLEFEYVRVDPTEMIVHAGGTLEFDRTPAGLWLIPAWEITLRYHSGSTRLARGQILETWMPRSQPSQ